MYNSSRDYEGQVISVLDDLRRRLSHLEALERPATSSGPASSFPTAPFIGERFWATDRGMEYFWNGTLWLSTQVDHMTLAGPTSATFSSSAFVTHSASPNNLTNRLYFTDFLCSFVVNTTFDAGNYWTFQPIGENGINNGYFPCYQSGRMPATRYTMQITLNDLVVAGNLSLLYLNVYTAGSPGPITIYPPVFNFRYVG